MGYNLYLVVGSNLLCPADKMTFIAYVFLSILNGNN
jgi:hypothetical protein